MMALSRKIVRQLWHARNMGIGHVMRKIVRRLSRGSKVPPASDDAQQIRASRVTERSTRMEVDLRILSEGVKSAFDDGRYADYVRLGAEAGELRDDLAREWGMDPNASRIVGSSLLGPFGHFALFDLFLKSQHLGLINRERFRVLADPNLMPNRAYFDLWRPLLDVREISAAEWQDINLLEWPICEKADFIRTNSGYRAALDLWDEVNRGWESERLRPLVGLPPEIEESGQRVLRKWGLDDDQWFVCFHVREGNHRITYRGTNADVATYELAMEEVVRRGGVAVRMGNPDMRPIVKRPGFIDYAHAVMRADWLDVFLWSRCRFAVGTGSGPIHVPGTLGVPVLMTNASAAGIVAPYSVGAMMITKHFHDSTTKRELSLAEALERRVGWNWSADFSRQGVEMRDNTPEELRDAVIDMFEGHREVSPAQANLAAQRRLAGSAITTPFAPAFSELMAQL